MHACAACLQCAIEQPPLCTVVVSVAVVPILQYRFSGSKKSRRTRGRPGRLKKPRVGVALMPIDAWSRPSLTLLPLTIVAPGPFSQAVEASSCVAHIDCDVRY